jgi:hypothetical protein
VPRGDKVSKWNDDAIARFPETDETWPPLIRSMLAAPRADQPRASFRGRRIISVALYGNHLEDGLAIWLPKFEGLLKQLHWLQACLYLNAGWCGDYDLTYEPDEAALSLRHQPDSKPIQTWEFRCIVRSTGAPAEHLKGVIERPGYTTNDWFSKPHEAVRHDRIRIERMLAAARVAQSTVQGRTRADLDTDDMFFRILVRLHDEISSDARHLGDEVRRRVPEVQWDWLGHPGQWDDWESYSLHHVKGDVGWKEKRDKLWNRAQEHLPLFIAQLEKALANWPTTDPPSAQRA